MLNDVNARARALALVVGTLLYTTAQSMLSRPGIAQPLTADMIIAGFAFRAMTLIGLVAVVERIALAWMTRRIRGDWVYQETSEYWGYARIFLQGSRLRYSVDLYKTRADLLKGLKYSEPVPTMGHGDSVVSFLDADGRFRTWYHVPAFLDYPERHGTLTLTPTNNANNYHGRWERTGLLGPPAQTSGDEGAAELARRDERQHSGTFNFFMRKRIFVSRG